MATNVAPIREAGTDLTARQLELIRRTVASDCNKDEFDLFIEVARRVGLDPFRKQIMPLVFSKKDESKRRMSIITGIDGFRVIAARCADYRPDEDEPDISYDPALKGPLNPLGIVRAKVTVWKMDRAGTWRPISGAAYWDEFAPVKKIWAAGDDGKRRPTDRDELDTSGNWPKMPRIMIAKCAEAQALRKGWPESFSGLYDAAELDRARAIDIDASEIIEKEAEHRRLVAVGGESGLIVDWGNGSDLDRVPVGQFADRVMAHIEAAEPAAALSFRDRNREAFREFWARSPGDALEVKKRFEAIERGLADASKQTAVAPVAAPAETEAETAETSEAEDAAFALKKRFGACRVEADIDALARDKSFQAALKALPAEYQEDVLNTARARRSMLHPLNAG